MQLWHMTVQATVAPAVHGASASAALNEGSHIHQTVLTFDAASSGAAALCAPTNAAPKSRLGSAADQDDITSCVTPDLGLLHASQPDEEEAEDAEGNAEGVEAQSAVSPNPKDFSFFVPASQKKACYLPCLPVFVRYLVHSLTRLCNTCDCWCNIGMHCL